MSNQDLRETLERLHDELHQTDAVDERSRQLLRELMDDIHAILEPGSGGARPESLTARLREAVGEFEDTHPTLTEAIGRVVDALAKMGI